MTDSVEPYRQSLAPPGWWIVVAVFNLLLYVVPACSMRQDRAELSAFKSMLHIPTASEKLGMAFDHSIASGLEQLLYESAGAVGTFFLAVVPAFFAVIINLLRRWWIRFLSWSLCFGGTVVLGVVTRLIVEG